MTWNINGTRELCMRIELLRYFIERVDLKLGNLTNVFESNYPRRLERTFPVICPVLYYHLSFVTTEVDRRFQGFPAFLGGLGQLELNQQPILTVHSVQYIWTHH